MGSSSRALLALVVGLLAFEAAVVSGFDYGDAVDKTLLFFEAQRSGKLPPNQRVKWRANSGLKDGFLQGVNLVGGYYDAGDHVKFGLPMAFSMTMLSWGCIEYRDEIVHLNQMGNTLAAIKWGTDYFIKAHTQPNVLWGEVGDGDSDHYCWERPEDMTTPRNAYKIDPEHPGSDLAGETAAALAAASIAFERYNSSYSILLLVHAKQLFSFADRFRGLYDDSIQGAQNFYASSGYADELLWAAAWLYRATYDDHYLKYVVDNAVSLGGTGWAVREFSWDNKYAGVQVLLSNVLLDGAGGSYTSTLQQYKAKADYFVCACVQKNDGYNVLMTPGGLIYVREWNNMQYVSAAAFLLAVYSDFLSKTHASVKCPDAQTQPQDLLNVAKSQADYILGKNPKSTSYVVGYGQNYPIHVHHRGASLASVHTLQSTIGCVEGFENWYRRPEANPNIIYGALVGGPNKNDEFIDDRSNYEQTEPTISGTAPLFGLFCKLQSLYGNSGYHVPGSKGPYENKAGEHRRNISRNLEKYYLLTQPINVPITIHDLDLNSYPLSMRKSKKTFTWYTGTTHQEPTKPHQNSPDVPVHFYHSITDTWTVGTMTYYRHKVIIKNISQKPVTDLKLRFEELSGSLWGLSPTQEKNTYELPQWLKVLQPGSDCTFVYVQGGSQAKVRVQSYH